MATHEEIKELAAALNEEAATEAPPSEEVAPPAEAQEAAPVQEAAPTPMAYRPELPQESKEFAELARRERAARETESRNKQMERELAELRGEIRGRGNNNGDLSEEARKDPLGFIKKHGISYEDLTNTILNGEKPTQSLEMRTEIEGLRSEIQGLKEAKEAESVERKRAEQASAYNKFIDDINDFVETSGSDCELIRLQGAQQLVGEVIRDNYAATGRTMPYKQACGIVEGHLEKQVRNSMRSSKFRVDSAQEVEAAPPVEEVKTSSRPTTLTNQNTASPAHVGDGVVREALLSREDSLKEFASLDFWGP